MNMFRLATRNLAGNSFRSGVVVLCAFFVSALALATTLIIQGAQQSLTLAIDRLGADILVVPQGTETRVETALLMGKPATAWMEQDKLEQIKAIPGVQTVSPQLYLASLAGASCCSASEMFVVAYDPATDFTIRPWLLQNLGGRLGLDEAVGGALVHVPSGEEAIKLYGTLLSLRGNLEPTGSGIDNTLFVTFETAQEVARGSLTKAEKPLEIPDRKISAALVKMAPGADPSTAAIQMVMDVPGVTPITSPDLFAAFRRQMTGLLNSVLLVLGLTWVLSVALISLVFSMAANERRRELGVLRALGATRRFVFQSLLVEAAGLALAGGAAGIAVAAFSVYLFQNLLVTTLGLPFLLPSIPGLLLFVGIGLMIALASVTLAALVPALKVSQQDPAIAMRE